MAPEAKGDGMVIEEQETKTGEVQFETQGASDVESKATEDQAREMGLTETEIKMGLEHGVIAKKGAETKDDKDANSQGKKDESQDQDPTKGFTPNEKAMYFERKKALRRAQYAEGERDFLTIQLKKTKEDLESLRKDIEEIRKGKQKPDGNGKDDDILDLLDDAEDDAKKGAGDTGDKVLTRAEHERLEKEKQEAQDIKVKKAQALNERLSAQEEDAREMYPDFNKAIKLAEDIFKNAKELFKDDPWKLEKVEEKMHRFRTLAANALDASPDDETAADMAYSIGKLHPNYRAESDGSGENTSDNGDAGAKDKTARILANAQSRKSSASLGGGAGRRSASEADITLEDASRMDMGRYMQLSPETRARIRRELQKSQLQT